MGNPRFSVVVPFYKTEAYIEACVESIRRQDIGDSEIILVDDGSPDSSGEIADRLAAQDSRITVLHKENGGPDAARLLGASVCTGDYVVFLDSDDIMLPGSLRRADDRLRQLGGGVDVLQMDYEYLFSDGARRQVGGFEKIFGGAEILSGTEFALNHFKNHNAFWSVWSRIYRREFLRQIPWKPLPGRAIEDLIVILRWCFLDCRVSWCPAVMVEYKATRKGSITGSMGYGLIWGHLYSDREALALIGRSPLAGEDRAFMERLCARMYSDYYFEIEKLPRAERKALYAFSKALGGRAVLKMAGNTGGTLYLKLRYLAHRYLGPALGRFVSERARLLIEWVCRARG